jgi:hypothetical protein
MKVSDNTSWDELLKSLEYMRRIFKRRRGEPMISRHVVNGLSSSDGAHDGLT